MNIVLLGAPASGKGTLGSDLAKTLDLPHISSGNLIRQNIANKTEIGQKVKELINRGSLVDDETMCKMIFERIAQSDCQKGFILDGFPRTLVQAEMLDEHFSVDFAIFIDVLEENAIKRISGRRVCTNCNKTYHILRLESENCPIYKSKNVLVTVDGNGTSENTTQNVLKLLKV